MEHRQHILVIEDNVMLAERWARQVFHRLDNVEVHIAHNEEDALNRIAHGKVDAIVSGYYFSEFHREGLRDRGFALIMHAVQALGRSVPVVFVARDVSPKDSFEAAKLGAFDFVFIEDQVQSSALLNAVRSALQHRRIPRLFISHSSADHLFAAKLATKLHNQGWQVWYDEWEIKVGDSIVRKIEEGLAGSGHLIVLLSEASVASRWVREEIDAALVRQLAGQHTSILPALIEECAIPPLLASKKYADFRSSFDTGFAQIVDAVGTQMSVRNQ